MNYVEEFCDSIAILHHGEIVLSVAVLSILISAPLGAIGIDATAARLLEKEKEAPQPIG